MNRIQIDGEKLTLEDLYRVMLEGAEAEIPAAARAKMNASRAVIERLVESGKEVYGVNTGFGKMATTRISPKEIGHLQLNLVRSHACGVGEPLDEYATRAILALRANTLHNLHFYLSLMAEARSAIEAGRFEAFRRERLAAFGQGK